MYANYTDGTIIASLIYFDHSMDGHITYYKLICKRF